MRRDRIKFGGACGFNNDFKEVKVGSGSLQNQINFTNWFSILFQA